RNGRGRDGDRRGASALPAHRGRRPRRVIDTHAHLDACEDDAEALVARAHAAGVDRIVAVGSGLESCRATLGIAERHEGGFAALGGFDGTVVLHCFSSPVLLPVALERGYYVSFAGNVTFPKAPELREAAAAVPPERILAETDSPYLAPQPRRGRPNEPAYVVHTVAALAEARGEDPAALADRPDAH